MVVYTKALAAIQGGRQCTSSSPRKIVISSQWSLCGGWRRRGNDMPGCTRVGPWSFAEFLVLLSLCSMMITTKGLQCSFSAAW